MLMENIQDYDQHAFRERFVLTDLYTQLQNDYTQVSFDKHWSSGGTPRQDAGTAKFSAVPFYYLEFLTAQKPTEIYDLGCGWNIFKKYIPNVIGIGAEMPDSGKFYGDIHNFVDDDFVRGHQDFFDSAFSINALHFHPLGDIQKIVHGFHSMLKPGGMGWLALSMQVMLERDQINFAGKTISYIDGYIRQELNSIDINFVVFDVDLAMPHNYMDGNIRLVIKRNITDNNNQVI